MKLILVLILLGFTVNTFAGLVAWDNVEFYENYPSDDAYSHYLDFYQDETATEYTGMVFNYDYDNSTISFFGITLDEGSEWYIVNYGDEISNATLGSGVYTPFNQQNVPIVVPNSFYLAGHTTLESAGDADAFCWVAFNQSASGLVMAGNAAAYDAISLETGTYNFVPVPEPSTWLLFLAGAIAIIGTASASGRYA